MRISDWSSDVCSSDLPPLRTGGAFKAVPLGLYRNHVSGPFCRLDVLAIKAVHRLVCHFNYAHRAKAFKRRPHGAAIGAEHADLDIVPGAYIRGQKKGPGHMIHIVAGRAVKAELFQPGFALFFPQEPNRKTPADRKSTRLNSSH